MDFVPDTRAWGMTREIAFVSGASPVGVAVAWFLAQRALVNLADVYAIDFRVAHALPAVLLVLIAVGYFRRAA